MKTAQTIKQQHRNILLVNWLLLGASGLFFVLSLINTSKNKDFDFKLMLSGTLTALGAVVTSEMSKSISARARVQQEADRKGLERQIDREHKLNEMVAGIKTQQKLAEVVEFTVPDYQQPRFIAQFKLQGLLPPRTPIGQPQETPESSQQGFQVKLQPTKELVDINAANLIDISWMNEDVFMRGGVIVGADGSGKTDLLKFIVLNILRLCPEADLKFYNIHYVKDPARRTEYFKGMDADHEASLFINTPQDILRDAEKVYSELQRREKVGDMNSYPIIRILDEQKATLAELGNEYDRLNFILKELVDRGRKYGKPIKVKDSEGEEESFDTGFSVWLALHSPKKEISKVDSSWFSRGSVFLLGKALSDSSAPFPVDFDRKTLVPELAATNKLLEANNLKFPDKPKKDKARACVYRSGYGDPCIKIIPRFNLDNIQYSGIGKKEPTTESSNNLSETQTEQYQDYSALDCSGDTWIEKILNWFRINTEVDNEILREQVNLVRKKMLSPEQYQDISDKHLVELRELLEQEVNGAEDDEEDLGGDDD